MTTNDILDLRNVITNFKDINATCEDMRENNVKLHRGLDSMEILVIIQEDFTRQERIVRPFDVGNNKNILCFNCNTIK